MNTRSSRCDTFRKNTETRILFWDNYSFCLFEPTLNKTADDDLLEMFE